VDAKRFHIYYFTTPIRFRNTTIINMEIEEIVDIIYLVSFAMLVLTVIILSIMFIAGRRLNQAKLTQQKLITQHKEELLIHTIDTQEKERDRLAAEIHDDITSKLNIIHIHMATIEQTAPPEVLDKIKPLNAVLKSSIVDSRRIAYDLFPVILEKFGLLTALEELQDLNTTKEMAMTLETTITNSTFQPSSAVHIYRIAQELINNSNKHAQCTNMYLGLSEKGPLWQLTYRDNGIGDANNIKDSNGMGMKNINSRLSVLRGSLDIHNLSPGIEFSITFALQK